MIGRVYYSVREGDYVVDLDDNNGWAFATAEEAEHFAEVFRAAVRYHAEVEREECARLCEYAAATDRAIASGWRDESTPSSDRLLAVARLIRARGSQEAPQRPEAASGAAMKRCPACNGRGVRRYDDGTVDGCDACGLLGRVATEGGER